MKENDFKQEHIKMWDFIVKKISNKDIGFDDKLLDIQGIYLENLYLKIRYSILSKEIYMGSYEQELLNMLEWGIERDCFACEFSKNCLSCPLLKCNGGKLQYNCYDKNSTDAKLAMALYKQNFDIAEYLAIQIRDAWRFVY